MEFKSRRSVVHSVKGMAASSQPLAAAVAVKLLEMGCNAAEAAVGCSAALAVVEPGMTSLGDMFCLHFDASTNKVEGLNGSGKSSHAIDLSKVKQVVGEDRHYLPTDSAFAVNVPGAAAAWIDTVEKWGSGHFSMKEILKPAIDLARGGFPVSHICAQIWNDASKKLQNTELLLGGTRAPKEGELFFNEPLAQTLERIVERGKEGFYAGPTADAIVEAVQSRGGVLDHEDLKNHSSLFLDPISVPVLESGVRLWELPPNNHGIVALLALNIIKAIRESYPELKSAPRDSAPYVHMITEALKFAFKEAEYWVADPKGGEIPSQLLSHEFAVSRAKLFDPKKVNNDYERGDVIPLASRSDTSYYTVVDREGNACSMISSLYNGFGTGIVPKNTGFALHNRGCNFSLNPSSRNALGPSKRSYHTIIPAMLTKDDQLWASFGVMGGFMQPQGHLQVSLNLLEFGLDPQQSLDSPRICLTPSSELRGGIPVPDPDATEGEGVVINLEEGYSAKVAEELTRMGHKVRSVTGSSRSLFGRGQVIVQDFQNGKRLYHAGSDPRGDGAAIPQV